MTDFTIKSKASRTLPFTDDIKEYIILTRAKDLPLGIPSEKVNARSANLNTHVAKQLEKTLLNQEGDPNLFVYKNRGIDCIASSITKNGTSDEGYDLFNVTINDDQGIIDGNHTYRTICKCIEDPESEISDEQFVKLRIKIGVPRDLIDDISEGLNTSLQVQKRSLANLRDEFQWIKDIFQSDSNNNISYAENDDGHYDIRHILSLIYMLNPELFPNSDRDKQPVQAYSSKAKVLEEYLKDIEIFKKMKPILKDICILYETIVTGGSENNAAGYRKLWNSNGGQAGALDATIKKTRKPWKYPFINQTSPYQLDKAWAYPIFASFRWYIDTDETGSFVWKNGFDNVLNVWETIGYQLLKLAYERYDESGRKMSSLGKTNTLWRQLHTEVKMNQS